MKSTTRMLLSLWPGIAMAFLILDTKTGLIGAAAGVELCIRTVIPSLFPFLFLSVMVTGSLLSMSAPVLRPIGRICRIPAGAEGLLAVGLLGGYPVGAQCVAQAHREGRISRETAQRMLGFCSNAGPAFIFGMISGAFTTPYAVWLLWGIHMLSAILTGVLLPGGDQKTILHKGSRPPAPAAALDRSLKTMASICGWVIIFRVLLAFLQRWFFWFLPADTVIVISGILELTNGCCQLLQLTNEPLRFVVASLLLAFGGLCVWLQTVSVASSLGTGFYFPGKLLQAAISLTLACIAAPLLYPGTHIFMPVSLLGLLVIGVLFLRKKRKNRSSILARQGV